MASLIKIIIAISVGITFGFSIALLVEKAVLKREFLLRYNKAVSDMLRWDMYYDKDGVKHRVKVIKED